MKCPKYGEQFSNYRIPHYMSFCVSLVDNDALEHRVVFTFWITLFPGFDGHSFPDEVGKLILWIAHSNFQVLQGLVKTPHCVNLVVIAKYDK